MLGVPLLMAPDERWRVAYHEGGHTILGLVLSEALRLRLELFALVAHDLRGPLTAIKSTTDLLQRQAMAGPPAARPAQASRRGGCSEFPPETHT